MKDIRLGFLRIAEYTLQQSILALKLGKGRKLGEGKWFGQRSLHLLPKAPPWCYQCCWMPFLGATSGHMKLLAAAGCFWEVKNKNKNRNKNGNKNRNKNKNKIIRTWEE